MLYRRLGNTGVSIPAIGQGTWKFGENKHSEKQEIEALRFGIANGLTHTGPAPSDASEPA
ncbi:hypothetical protein SAMN04487897_13424 [Paenibacillus sp. yr247]|uniref:hypothetical protein n=1 Tax=Paenibacillus sp. yr247 TaxID=1761880 RepID=UPI00088C1E88|nr:hypothetical protein [Paenibacillus sp. yr247]SDP07098.1 hypothetical protein SAMN04487897_13424 [Paenibacillus sp. yr247]